jgi:hypothetical protein
MERTQTNPRNFSNLYQYRSHGPPTYGRGIYAPYFAASPMRSDFNRGDIPYKGMIVFNTECCDNYAVSTKNSYVNPKMLRQKNEQ